jgi:hypothetical protein
MMEITRDEAVERFPAIRIEFVNSIFRYSEEGVPTGGFLTRVLTNDLFGAMLHYSGDSFEELQQLIWLVYGYMPSLHHGSIEKVNEHLKQTNKTEIE